MLNARTNQAAGLAHFRAESSPMPAEASSLLSRTSVDRPFRVVPILSALPGVGRRTLLRQLILADLRSGGQPLALDEDADTLAHLFGLANHARSDLIQHLDGHETFESLISQSGEGIRAISAELGLASLALRPVALARFLDHVANRVDRISTLWINARAARDGVVTALAELGAEALIVTTTDTDAMTATYQLAKRMSAQRMLQLRVLYNCATAEQAARAHEGLSEAAQRFIGLRIDCLGSVPFDPLLAASPPGVRRRAMSLTAAGRARPALDRVLRELNRVVPPSPHSTFEQSNV
jgi:MinD-like ATPase involved in chromosome partitioning or flagellar assembly